MQQGEAEINIYQQIQLVRLLSLETRSCSYRRRSVHSTTACTRPVHTVALRVGGLRRPLSHPLLHHAAVTGNTPGNTS